MNTSSRFRFLRPVAVLALCGAACVGSAQALTNPPIRMVEGVETMCGGRTAAEMAFMDMVSPRWAATLEFAVSGAPRGAFPAHVRVAVRDRYNGHQVMDTTADGPLMVARLEAGSYDVEATVSGLTLVQTLTVFEGAASKAVFQWPSNFDFVSAAATEKGLTASAAKPAATSPQARVDTSAVRGRQTTAAVEAN